MCPNEFIATQGPLPGTVADFWRMIWETGTRTVAMLTQCFEKGKVRNEHIDTSVSGQRYIWSCERVSKSGFNVQTSYLLGVKPGTV